jgi:hypothetical protein
MKHWKVGFLVVTAAALLVGAGAGGRAAVWAAPEGAGEVVASQPNAVALADSLPTGDADAEKGFGCAEAALTR